EGGGEGGGGGGGDGGEGRGRAVGSGSAYDQLEERLGSGRRQQCHRPYVPARSRSTREREDEERAGEDHFPRAPMVDEPEPAGGPPRVEPEQGLAGDQLHWKGGQQERAGGEGNEGPGADHKPEAG